MLNHNKNRTYIKYYSNTTTTIPIKQINIKKGIKFKPFSMHSENIKKIY